VFCPIFFLFSGWIFIIFSLERIFFVEKRLFQDLDELFDVVQKRAQETVLEPSTPKASLLLVLTGEPTRQWFLNLDPPKASFGEFTEGDYNLKVTVAHDVFLGIVNRTQHLKTAFLLGKIKMEGDVALAGELMKIIRTIA
jgi:putative sterol carrier protein